MTAQVPFLDLRAHHAPLMGELVETLKASLWLVHRPQGGRVQQVDRQMTIIRQLIAPSAN
jgi:hypothetical protein